MIPILKLKDFDFKLPKSLIAQKPLTARDKSKLMIINRKLGSIEHEVFSRLPYLIPQQSLMVFNNTKVIPSKLLGYNVKNNKPVEILLVKETDEKNKWEALIKGLSKIRVGTKIEFGCGELKTVLKGRHENKAILELQYHGRLDDILNRIGEMPLPPYIRRNTYKNKEISNQDRERYQTVFASLPGAIAAPTAGLHFTPSILKLLNTNGIDTKYLTLHVGEGTFQPIRVENIIKHKMQPEKFYIPEETSKALINSKEKLKKIVGIGSTVTRVLESVDLNNLHPSGTEGWTNRFIYPGVKFKVVDHLITNFHLPKSTLYLLVCAFAGKKLITKAYKEAILKKYRFFSYGDAMLII
ncbi:MAG: tRNA preQ1(34) S-adenosylmethionine ribosyltransferase-isomerase QueA [Nitrospina sp.]|jgi:S-adenosylmethionine:tRNA ribosyltransferase-isomerase|nr:tRNA preQ1(34) S-adenosylmethionine ribosyltransferase-isomerase QueA [Nitrospina sp.]MBT6295925.1 tRNA preQ1(34) S-adenosylmethionine ribosyltransferase-isomerase QueA [Nitrospina sp.]MBT6600314.1 tRNA preQ1(34) S-adenosylmethionine ribosyltransferase-isomerase QueA [Nitrospina sp.]